MYGLSILPSSWHDSLHLCYDSLHQSHLSFHPFHNSLHLSHETIIDSTRLQSTQLLNYLTFRSIYIVIHSFNLMFCSINDMDTIQIDPSWLDMTKKPIFGLTRKYLMGFPPSILWFTPLDMTCSIYIVIHFTQHDTLHLYCNSLQ